MTSTFFNVENFERLQALFVNLQMGILVESGDRKIVSANPSFKNMFGIPSDQNLEGVDCASAAQGSSVLFQDPENFIKRIDEILSVLNYVQNDKLKLKDGRIFERDFVPVYREKKFIGNMWIYRDISDKERMMQQLKESEAQYKLISENSSDGIALMEGDSLVYVSEGYLKMLGYKREELLNTSFNGIFDIIHPDDRERAFSEIEASRQKLEKNQLIDLRLQKKDGGYVWVEDEISRIFNDEGELISSVIHSRDITGRKLAEIRLSDSRERFSSLIDNMEEGLVLHDPTGKIVESNEKARDILELTADMLDGKSPMEFEYATIKEDGSDFPPDQHPASITLQQGKSVKNVIMGIRKSDVHTVWIKINSEPLFFEKKEPYAMVTFSDITRLKQKESELVELNTKKDRLISIIGHDLRNPIQAMKSLSELMQISIEQNNTDDLKKISQLIIDSADNSLELINDLLEWGRIENNEKQYNNEKVNLKHITQNIFDLFRYPIQNKKLKTEIRFENGQTVVCNRFIIDLLLRNLISNAVKFTPKMGKIMVDGRRKDNSFFEIKVIDTGMGIDEALIPKLFDIQQKFSTKGTDNEKGSGLGLVLCYDYLQNIGGHIEVESKKKQGTTFTIRFPVEKSKEVQTD